MAQSYKKVDPRIWDDEGFQSLAPLDKLITFNAFTAQSNRIGLFRYSFGLGIEQTGIDAETFAKGFRNVCDTFEWTYNESRRVLYIPTWWKYNQPQNPNVLIGCLEDLHNLPQCPEIKRFTDNFEYIDETLRETFRKRLGKHSPIQEQEQEQEQEQDLPPNPQGGNAGGFLLFWNSLPKISRDRSSQKQAKAEWKKKGCEKITDRVLSGLAAWKNSELWVKENGKFIRGAHRWLKDELWKEKPTPAENGDSDYYTQEQLDAIAEYTNSGNGEADVIP